MRKSRNTTQARRTRAKPLAVTKDAVKSEVSRRYFKPETSLVGAVFDSQLAMAQLIFQLSPLAIITRQQALMIDTFAGALNGALEGGGTD
jgi:hypothetical protein